MDQFYHEATAWLVTSGIRLTEAILLVVFGWLLARVARAGVDRWLPRTGLDPTWTLVLSRSMHSLLLLIVFLAALNTIGVQTTSVITILGAAGLAVALAWQSALANLAAGMMILSFRLFRIGDVIETLGVTGRVEDIRLFHTILVDAGEVRIIVPNGKITDNLVRNHSAAPRRRFEKVVVVNATANLEDAKATIRTVLAGHARVLRDPPPEAILTEIAPAGATLLARAWAASSEHAQVTLELTELLKGGLDSKGIQVVALK